MPFVMLTVNKLYGQATKYSLDKEIKQLHVRRKRKYSNSYYATVSSSSFLPFSALCFDEQNTFH